MGPGTLRSGARLGLAALLALGCRVRIDDGAAGGGPAIPAASGEIEAVRVACPTRLPPLEERRRPVPLPGPARRVLSRGEETLVDLERGGLGRLENLRWTPILPDGEDHAFASGGLVRLETDRIVLHRYVPGGTPRPARAIPARRHAVSLAVLGRSVWVHSPTDRGGHLVVRRSLDHGAIVGRAFHVERDFLRALLVDPDRLLEDLGVVRAGEGRVAFVPLVRGPVRILDPGAGRVVAIELQGGRDGAVRTLRRRTVDAPARCRGCVARRKIETRQAIERRLVDGALWRDALWVLRPGPPGAGSTLVRLPLERPGRRRGEAAPTPEAWWIADAGDARALALDASGPTIATAGEVRFYSPPEPGSGGACSLDRGPGATSSEAGKRKTPSKFRVTEPPVRRPMSRTTTESPTPSSSRSAVSPAASRASASASPTSISRKRGSASWSSATRRSASVSSEILAPLSPYLSRISRPVWTAVRRSPQPAMVTDARSASVIRRAIRPSSAGNP